MSRKLRTQQFHKKINNDYFNQILKFTEENEENEENDYIYNLL